jgi:acyl phosphate:glycerol-3-phosphate acyltransferase
MVGYIILILAVCLIIGYLFGSISNGIILSKKVYNKDVRDYGSHNSGGTNMGRVFGLKAGLITIALDMAKTIIPFYACYLIIKFTSLNTLMESFDLASIGAYTCGLGSVLGHCFPIFYHFKGGKAVSCMAGIIIASSWSLLIVGVIIFFSIFLTSHKVSLSSIFASLGTALSSIALIFLPNWLMNASLQASYIFSGFMIVYSIILIARHHANIQRLINGTEKNIYLTKKK